MSRISAWILVALMMAGVGTAQTAKASGAYINKAALTRAAISAGTATANVFPIFTDTAGDVANSIMAQSGSNIGVNTASPLFNLHVIGLTDPAAIAIEGYGAVGVNFIGRRAEGTHASPLHLNANDNIFILQGRGYGTSGFSQYSRASIKMVADENWSDSAQGTYILFATTPDGTAPAGSAAERMRIANNGNVGIGTSTPANPLSVNGVIQSMTGGFKFPDGTVMTTAAVGGGGGGGVTITSPDSSITVGGTATAPTLAANTAVVQHRVSGSCAVGSAIASISQTGTVTCQATSGGAGSGLSVKDANGNVLGTLIGVGGPNGTDATIYTHGFIVTVGITGQFLVGSQAPNTGGVVWTGNECNGTPYLPGSSFATIMTNFPTTYARQVVYSATANQLMVPVPDVANGATATAANVTVYSEEASGYGGPDYTYADGVSNCIDQTALGASVALNGWLLTPIDPATTLGWTVSGSPLSVAGPLQLP